MRHLIAGNWKMNGLAASLEEAARIAEGAEALQGRVRRDALPAGDADRADALADGEARRS